MRIRNAPPQMFEGAHQLPELLALIDAEDLVRVKALIPSLVALAAELPSWGPILGLARGAYHLLRGDPRRALELLDGQLLEAQPTRHIAWASLMKAKIACLLQLGRTAEAIEAGRHAVEVSREHGLYIGEVYSLMSLGLSLAARGQHAEARMHLDQAIELLLQYGATGVLLGMAHEARARAALLADDRDAFKRASASCAEQYRAGHNPVLTAKYERLMQRAYERHVRVSKELADAAQYTTRPASLASMRDSLAPSAGIADRARKALETLAQELGCGHGFLYVVAPGGPALSARIGSQSAPRGVDDWVRQCIDDMFACEDPESELATAVALDPLPSIAGGGEPLVPLVLTHSTGGRTVVTAVAVLDARQSSGKVDQQVLRQLSEMLADSPDAPTGVFVG